MEFNLKLRKITVDVASGETLAVEDKAVGTATMEQIHNWLSTGDSRVWEQQLAESK